MSSDTGEYTLVPLAEPEKSSDEGVRVNGSNEKTESSEKLESVQKCNTTCCVINFLKTILLLFLLYLFICSLGVMGSAFTLIGGSTAGKTIVNSEIMNNPISALMVGVLITVLVQSSSTSTSLIVTMVAADLIKVRQAIPMVMGANIGTSITNTIVSIGQVTNLKRFKKAFAGATVHDCFNWLSVLVLLPVEVATGYLYRLTGEIVGNTNAKANEKLKVDFLKIITKPLTKSIIQLDKGVIAKIALGETDSQNMSLVKRWCDKEDVMMEINVTESINGTNVTNLMEVTNYTNYIERCDHLFSHSTMSDTVIGGILLAISLTIMMICLVSIVKLLQSMLKGGVDRIVKKVVNAKLPGKVGKCLTGYITILVGAGLTMLLQSSSIFTSALTPLVGLGVVDLKRAYPLTLGANIGTTMTGLLAALANADARHFEEALQIALCHFFFNISGILIWFPIPFLRKIPISAAKKLGEITAKYRWFPLFYLAFMFFALPGLVFALSLAGWIYPVIFAGIVLTLTIIIVVINQLQKKAPQYLPRKLRNWEFLPQWMRSLEWLDNCMGRMSCLSRCCCKKLSREAEGESGQEEHTQDEKEETKLPNHITY
ncbi:sodium-dependent phosphate transport protein 2B-like [Ptychodera flava]|uniref:sodium-dependent phosphate transport protein 2B-like n=1 Tax=Ptychodera flava TaxID=63121 RepID=UPI00396A2ED3